MQTWSEALMDSDSWTSHLPPSQISAEEYDALPEEVARRIEVVDGRSIMSPSPSVQHQLLVLGLAAELRSRRPDGLRVVFDIDVRLVDVPLRVRRPDIVVCRVDPAKDVVLRPQHVALVVEVVSPNSVATDRLHKAAEYAAAGIAHYWRVEMDPLAVHTYALERLGYVETGVHRGRLLAERPFPVEIELEGLLLR